MHSPIIDLIIRIKNAYQSGREETESPYSIFREEVVKKLIQMKYVKGYKVTGDKKKTMTIELLYSELQPAVTGVKIFSRPGRRWYVSVTNIKPVLGGLGYSVISTPKGVLTHIEAKKNRVGGELLFSIW